MCRSIGLGNNSNVLTHHLSCRRDEYQCSKGFQRLSVAQNSLFWYCYKRYACLLPLNHNMHEHSYRLYVADVKLNCRKKYVTTYKTKFSLGVCQAKYNEIFRFVVHEVSFVHVYRFWICMLENHILPSSSRRTPGLAPWRRPQGYARFFFNLQIIYTDHRCAISPHCVRLLFLLG